MGMLIFEQARLESCRESKNFAPAGPTLCWLRVFISPVHHIINSQCAGIEPRHWTYLYGFVSWKCEVLEFLFIDLQQKCIPPTMGKPLSF